ncbi:hypothetical protein GCM10009007_20500 [Formosimonas limnophila]|uniref:Transglycosylase SLT domain-containing protein n=1 Tax=Formosimonas limnophila TaxID=1384487 RepID=A0A8J3CJ46_9BURK|nr:transglycosylase SLT domain-containing protein [Formosimonas limnophila]GHA79420.1 hypothetical protein GCM10009007_20500 [Formosimonas limnophila]
MALKHDKDGFLVGRGGKDILEVIHDNTEEILNHVKAVPPAQPSPKLHIGLKLPKASPPTPQSKPRKQSHGIRHRDANGRFIERGALPTAQDKKINQSHAVTHKAQQEQIKLLKRMAKQKTSDKSYQPTPSVLRGKGLNRAAMEFVQGKAAGQSSGAPSSKTSGFLGGSKKLLGGVARAGGGLMRRLPVLGTLLGLGTAAWQMSRLGDANLPDEQKGHQKAGVWGKLGGGLAGAAAGGVAGATIGSVVPVVGTALGGMIGAAIGSMEGEQIGQNVGEWLYQKDWKSAWDNTRHDMTTLFGHSTRSLTTFAQNAFERFQATFPVIAGHIQAMAQSVQDVAKTAMSNVMDGIQAAKDAFHDHNVQGANPDGTPTTAQKMGAAVGSATRTSVDWLKSKNPFSYEGLKLKAGATNGGTTENGLTAMVHAINDRFGKDVLRHASLNDEYHKNMGYHSLHKDGLGFDTTFDSANQMQAKGLNNGKNTAAKQRYNEIKQYVESMGFTVGGKGTDIQLIDEYNNKSKKATGGHIHFAFRNKGAAKRYEDMVRHGLPSLTQSAVPLTQTTPTITTGASQQIIKPKGAKGSFTMAQLNQTFALDDKLGLQRGMVAGQMYQESKLDPNAVSHAGAKGWAQIMPKTQAGHEADAKRTFNPANFEDALKMQEMSLNTFRYKNGKRALGKVSDEAMFRGYNGGWNGQAGKLNGAENREYYAKVMAGRQLVLAAMGNVSTPPKSKTAQPNKPAYPITGVTPQTIGSPMIHQVTAPSIQTPAIATQAIAVPSITVASSSSQRTQVPVVPDSNPPQAPYLAHKSLSQRVSHDKIAWAVSGGIGIA